MADAQPLTDTPSSGKPSKQRDPAVRKVSRWRRFWMRRSGSRIVWALALALLALLAAIYLALPANDQQLIAQVALTVAQSLGQVGLTALIEIILLSCTLSSFALLFMPGSERRTPVTPPLVNYPEAASGKAEESAASRQYHYLTPPTATVPDVSVYIDGENDLSIKRIATFIEYLRGQLGGRRADLMVFMDALASSTDRYKTFLHYGFRLVNAPHDPTGTKDMFEAVDREIALHALERGLLGPARQEFILVTSDGDFAPLVYRLVALGHNVRVWSSSESNTYEKLKEYLSVYPEECYSWVNLAPLLGAPPDEMHPAEKRDANRSKTSRKSLSIRAAFARKSGGAKADMSNNVSWHEPQIHPPQTPMLAGQEKLYYAIVATLDARQFCENNMTSDASRDSRFIGLLGEQLQPRIADVGYFHPSKVEYWRMHLTAIGVLAAVPGAKFPKAGDVEAELGAQQLYRMAQVIAEAATLANPRPDGLLNMDVILLQLAKIELSPDAQETLAPLIAVSNGQRFTHIRYLLYCARALGIMTFDTVQTSRDLISNPELNETATASDGAGEPA